MAQTFDQDMLLEQVDGDLEFLADAVDMLSSDGPDLLQQIRQSIDEGDATAVGNRAHTIKGMLSNFCAPEPQALALQLEKAGKAGDLSGTSATIYALEANVTALIAELSEFIRSKS